MAGFDSPLCAGLGLPRACLIELKVEQLYGQNRAKLTAAEFTKCRSTRPKAG